MGPKQSQSLPTTESPLPSQSQHQLASPGTSTTPQSLKSEQSSLWGTVLSHLKTNISLEHADIPIVACCFVSGLCDSSAYNAWSCFVSMQTGNTIFLALGASGQPANRPYGWLKSLVSILLFLCGCVFFASTRYFDPMRRGTLMVSFLLQGACIFVAAALVQAGVVPSPKGLEALAESTVSFIELLPLAFLAFQSGGQIVTSRLLGFNEVPTTVLTSVYCDLASDPKFFKKDNVKRNRRLGAVITLLLGGIVGGWLSRSNAGMSTALWIAGSIKIIIALGWSFWRGSIAL